MRSTKDTRPGEPISRDAVKMPRVGDIVRAVPHFLVKWSMEERGKKPTAVRGTVIYVNPEHLYYTVEYDGSRHIRESFRCV